MQKDGTLSEKLRPHSGDLTFGAVVTAMLFFGALAGRLLLAPHGSAREGWLMRIYMQIGDPEYLQRRIVRGESRRGRHRCARRDHLARLRVSGAREETRHPPSVAGDRVAVRGRAPSDLVVLRDPFAGPNPLVVIAALGCGLVWGLLVARTGRLPVAHLLPRALYLGGGDSVSALAARLRLGLPAIFCISSSDMSKSA